MKNIKSFFGDLWNDESGQGTAEYVLLLVVVVALVFIFKDKIKTALSSKMDELGGKINELSPND